MEHLTIATHYAFNNMYLACSNKDYATLVKCFEGVSSKVSEPTVVAQLIVNDPSMIEVHYTHCTNDSCIAYHRMYYKFKIDLFDSAITQLVLSIHQQIKDNDTQLVTVTEQVKDLVMFKDFYQMSTF